MISQISSGPSWHAAVCRPPSLLWHKVEAITLLMELRLPPPHRLSTLAGRTALHKTAWQKVTSDVWVLSATTGYQLEFTAQPYQSHQPVTMAKDSTAQAISNEVVKLLGKGAITEVSCCEEPGFVSRIFLVPKKDGQMRPVINLKSL